MSFQENNRRNYESNIFINTATRRTQPMMTMTAVIFVLCYAMIALEHPIKINKSSTALIAAGLMWTLYSFASPLGIEGVVHQLTEKLAETAAIVFFLICAMTIVEVTDSHGGFEVITSRIKATKLTSLLWIIGFITFYLSWVFCTTA